jgi:polar amino acid transport system substrate-binding protein
MWPTIKNGLTTILILLFCFLAYEYGKSNSPAASTVAKESTYERVLRTGEIRCAYAPYAPALIKDPNTGQLSGIFYDVVTEIGRRLNLKIDWVEEVGYGVIAQGFETNSYDAFCNTVFPTPERSRAAGFTIPLYYSPVGIFVRADDHRFDNDFSKLDDPSVRFSVRDGDISAAFEQEAFPHATQVSVPQLSDTSQLLDEVVHKKADATINEPGLLYLYLETNPGSVVNIAAEHPIRVSPNSLMIKANEYQFKMMLDTTLQEMLNSGFIDKVLKKYEKYPIFLHVAVPYQPVLSAK